MLHILTLATDSMGTTIEILFNIVLFFGALLFMAKDFKIGLMMGLVFEFLLCMWFYAMDWDFTISFIGGMVYLILLALSVFLVNQSKIERNI